jgi:radial spoke head protein 9
MSEVRKPSSYFHFREAVGLKSKTLLEKADLDPSLDFMDSLEHDIPKGQSSGPCHLPFSSGAGTKVPGGHWWLEVSPGGWASPAPSHIRHFINVLQ